MAKPETKPADTLFIRGVSEKTGEYLERRAKEVGVSKTAYVKMLIDRDQQSYEGKS